MHRHLIVLGVATLVVIAVTIVFIGSNKGASTPVPAPSTVAMEPSRPAVPAAAGRNDAVAEPGPAPEEAVPASPASPAAMSDSERLAEAYYKRIGVTPPIDQNAPGAASVVEALRTGKHPERLSIAFKSTPFDPEAFAKDPEAYLSVIEPGRVFAVAQPGPTVPRLTALVAQRQEVVQGGQVELVVRTAPLAPVSFTSLDLGIFAENTLAAITVRADAEGIARAHLQARPGTVGEVSTLAGSPMAAGQIRFLLVVNCPAE